jgi:hypothetical protein
MLIKVFNKTLKFRNEILTARLELVNKEKLRHQASLTYLKRDGVKESKVLEGFLREKGIFREVIKQERLQSNGLAKRLVPIIIDKDLCMLMTTSRVEMNPMETHLSFRSFLPLVALVCRW